MMDIAFLVILVLYLGSMVVLGFVNRKVDSLSDFFLASRKLEANSVGLTLSATVIGGSAVIVTCSLVFTYGLAGLWYDIGAVLGLVLLGLWMGPRVRSTGAHSLPDLIGLSFGKEGKVVSSVLLVMVEVGWIALLLQASNFILSESLAIGSGITLAMAAGVFIGYTALGGQMAVVKTDKVQISLVVLSLLAILFALISRGADVSTSGLSFPVSGEMGPSLAVSAFMVMFLSHLVGPDIYSKLFSAKGPKEAGRGALTAGLIRMMVSLTVASIALLGISHYGDSVSAGSLLPTAAKDLLPPFISVIVLMGLLSIMLSSADSCLLSGATFVSWDLMGSDRAWARTLTVVAIGGIAYLVAIYSPGIISTLTLSYTLFSAGMVPVVILSMFRERLGLNRWGAIASFIAGSGSVLVLYFMKNEGYWDGSLLFLPLAISTSSLLLVSYVKNRLDGIDFKQGVSQH